MIVAYDESTFTFICAVVGCTLLYLPFILAGIVLIVSSIVDFFKRLKK